MRKIRNLIRIKKVGHAGTLDPLATGLLIICTGKFTKKINEYMSQEKEYTGTFVIGQTTPSHDLETDVSVPIEIDHLTDDIILRAAQKFTGTIQQIPPLHSAIKVGGKRAYALARKGEEVVLKPREVTISTFEITNITKPHIRFRIVCSKGTYIRSLARDFGNELGTGAYLAELCRTRIGEFKLADAQELDQINPEVK